MQRFAENQMKNGRSPLKGNSTKWRLKRNKGPVSYGDTAMQERSEGERRAVT